jgi:Aminoglycoside adenylyltransferase, C-terminal domain/Nucleotidyltransferase domain
MLAYLLAEVRAVLGDDLVGFYLYGSLSLGDFDPESSDIDFLIATRGVLPAATLDTLAAMHARIAASGLAYAGRLEGSYIPLRTLRRYDPDDNLHPTIGMDWEFGLGPHKTNWIVERHILREHGHALFGPPPRDLIDPVAPDELRAATREMLLGFWSQQLDGPEWLRTREYQAFAILTMCRALHTLAEGTVVSKRVAADWAKRALDPAWSLLINRALAWRHDHAPDDMGEMLRFVAWAVEQAREMGRG